MPNCKRRLKNVKVAAELNLRNQQIEEIFTEIPVSLSKAFCREVYQNERLLVEAALKKSESQYRHLSGDIPGYDSGR